MSELERLEQIQRAAWSAAVAGDRRAIEVVLKAMKVTACLLGLTAG